jgi:hypothetical protein
MGQPTRQESSCIIPTQSWQRKGQLVGSAKVWYGRSVGRRLARLPLASLVTTYSQQTNSINGNLWEEEAYGSTEHSVCDDGPAAL